MFWQTSERKIPLNKVLVMGILNVTPDSFSDGGAFAEVDLAISHAERMIAEGADIIDIGGESTRPGSERVSETLELERVIPVIKGIKGRFDTPISIDTSKSTVADAAAEAGAEIINDISGLRFDVDIAEVAAKYGTGLVLMHSRGTFDTMHSQPPVDDVLKDVSDDFHRSVGVANERGVPRRSIVLDIGIGFGKTMDQNLELIAKLDKLIVEFPDFPFLVGSSRKSFIGKVLGDIPTQERLAGSLASVAIAVWNGAKVVRVHDVKETVQAVRMIEAVQEHL